MNNSKDKRPNIIIFNPDQWRGDTLGHMGNPAASTPNLDQLVQTDGVSFRDAYCQNTVCTPSRCSFMSGWYPHTRGHRTMYHMLHAGKDENRDEPNLLKDLKDSGYFVWWGGKNDLVPGEYGFDEYCNIKHKPDGPIERSTHAMHEKRGDPDGDNFYSFYLGELEKTHDTETYRDGDDAHVEGAIDFIKNRPAEAEDKPFCIYLPLHSPHPPYAVEQPWFSLIDRNKLPRRIPRPDNWEGYPSIMEGICKNQNLGDWPEDRWNELRAVYYGMCAKIDNLFGQLVASLKQSGQYDNTAIFFFSDHGDFTGDYGLAEKTQNTFQDCLSRVPFIVKPPANWKTEARVSQAMTELIDFTATAYELADITPAHDHFGRSLKRVIAGETDQHRDAVFCEGGRRKGEEHCMEKDSTSASDINQWYWPRLALQIQDNGPEHTKAVMCRTKNYKYVRRLYESDELYDLRTDPGEENNRIKDPELAEVLISMKDRMLSFFMDTGDVVPHKTDKR